MRAFLLYFVLVLNTSPLFAATGDATLAETGVRVEMPVGDGKHFSQGSGIFLGSGLVLTAAHVVQVNPNDARVTIILDSRAYQGVVVFDGHQENLDLALVRTNVQSLPIRRQIQAPVPVCEANPAPNQPVTVSSMGTVTSAATISSAVSTDGQSGTWTNLLSTAYHHGNSGGGVFSSQKGCLWGIITLELSGNVNGHFVDMTAFIPATKIAEFLNHYQSQLTH